MYSLPDTTVDSVSSREIGVRTTGHERMRITVLLAALTDNRKLKPAVLIPRKWLIRALERFRKKYRIVYSGMTSWMDKGKIIKYLSD